MCEYEDRGDLGFLRETVDDQVHFITNELELSDEQVAYLLYKLGLDVEQGEEALPGDADAEHADMHASEHDGYAAEASAEFGMQVRGLGAVGRSSAQ